MKHSIAFVLTLFFLLEATPILCLAEGESPHAYFEMLVKRPEKVADYSLRSNEQIDQYRSKKSAPSNVTYNTESDKDPRKQDAAKIVIPAKVVSLPTQVRVPIPDHTKANLLVTWDAWFGKEFMFDKTSIGNYKNFQFSSGRIWTEVRSRFKLGFENQKPPAIAMVDVRQYKQDESQADSTVDAVEFNGINYGGAVLGPMKGEFAIQPETWTRYWVLFNPKGDGLFEFSLWVADENRDAIQLLDKVVIAPNKAAGFKGWDKLWLEYNTSSHSTPTLGERVAYARNIVMLANVADVPSLLQKPKSQQTVTKL